MSRVKIKDIAKEISERIDDPKNSGIEIFVGLEHYDSGCVRITRFGSTKNLDSSVKKFKVGDILIARRNVYLKRAGIVDFDGVTSGDSIVIRANDETIKKLLPFVFNSGDFWNYAAKHADGSMSKRLSPKILMEYEIDLPSSEKQLDILNTLWSINNTIETYKEFIKKNDDLLKAKFGELMSDVKRFKKICELTDVITGGTPSTEQREYWENGNIPWLRSGCCQDCDVKEPDGYITKKGYENSSARIMPINTVMIALTGATASKLGYLKIEACGNQSITGILPCEEIKPKILFYYLLSIRGKILGDCVGAAQPHISQGYVKNILVPILNAKSQNEFEKLIISIDNVKIHLQKNIVFLEKVITRIYGRNIKGEKRYEKNKS